MLKTSASFVLASLKGSPYDAEYDSPLRSLWPRWTAFLNILGVLLPLPMTHNSSIFQGWRNDFSMAC